VFSSEALEFYFEEPNPKNGMKKVFSKNGIVELLKRFILVFL